MVSYDVEKRNSKKYCLYGRIQIGWWNENKQCHNVS